MSAPFQPGDVVVCVDNAPDRRCQRPELLAWLAVGRHYRVRTTGLPFDCIHVNGDGLSMLEGWQPHRFRKIDDEVTEEFREQLANLPVREPVQ
jgi:hypothetical protein